MKRVEIELDSNILGHEYNVLVASFGFDIDFVIRRLATRSFKQVILLSLYTSEEAFRKIEKAYHTLSAVCKSLNIDCKMEKLEPGKLIRSVLSILQAITHDPEVDRVEIYLTGGPRMLVISTLISALLLPSYLASKIEIVIEGEGFDCEARLDLLKYLKLIGLDERDKKILFELQARGPQKLSELEDSTGIPRSTLYRRLEGLVEKELTIKKEDKYIAEDIVNIICRD